MRTSRILIALFALVLALSSLTSGTPIAFADESATRENEPGYFSQSAPALLGITEEQDEPSEYLQYTDPEFDFRISYPSNWILDPGRLVDEYTYVWESKLVVSDNPYTLIYIDVSLNDEHIDLEQWLETVLNSNGFSINDATAQNMISESTIPNESIPCFTISYPGAIDHQTVFLYDDYRYSISVSHSWEFSNEIPSSSTLDPSDFLNDYDRLIQSFEIGNPNPTIERIEPPASPNATIQAVTDDFDYPVGYNWTFNYLGHPSASWWPDDPDGVSDCFGTPYENLYHAAQDRGNPAGTVVRSVADGVVYYYDSNYAGYPGKVVIVQHETSTGFVYSMYAHLDAVNVYQGQTLAKGDAIGTILSWVFSSGTDNSHLHWEMRYNGSMASVCNNGFVPGPGYTYPLTPDNYGYTDPAAFIEAHQGGGTTCDAPELTSPGHGETVTSRDVTFHWDAPDCPGLTGYTIHITTGEGPEDGILRDSAASLTEYSYTFDRDGTFYWHVAAWANGVRGPWADHRIVVSTSIPVNQWSARYYDNETCWNDPGCDQSCRCKETIAGPELHKDWGTGAPCGGMDTDNWVADYRATIHFSPGYYIFNLDHDDGARLWVDGDLIADRAGKANGPVCGEGGFYLSGDTDVRVMLHEESGDAKINLTWTTDMSACNPPPSAPSLTSPANGATFNESDAITLSWSDTGDDFYGEVWGGPAGTVAFGWQTGTAKNIGTQWAGYTYSWHVRARNSGGTSDWSATRTFTVRPATPTGLSAQASACNRVNLTWTDNSGSEEGYRIYRGGAAIATVGANATSYADESVSGSTAYSYTVRAYRGSIESSASNSASVTTPACCVPTAVPPRPTVISPTNGEVLHTTEPTLQWSDLSQYCLEYYNLQVYDASGTTIVNVWPHTSTYTVSAGILIEGETYDWAVWARNVLGFGEGLQGTFSVAGQLPPAPTLLTPADLSVFTEGDPVEFTWSAVDAESYQFYLSGAGVNYQSSVSQPSISFDTGLWGGHAHLACPGDQRRRQQPR